jgi:hypothetical protein
MRRAHRSPVLALAFALVALFWTTSVGAAAADDDDHGGGRARVAPIAGDVDGRSAADLLATAVRQDYTLPVAEHPFGGGDPCVRLGKHGRVLVLTRPTTCTIERGDEVIYIAGASCSDVEGPPFHAVGADAQRECATRLVKDGFHSVLFSVDGGRQVEVARDRFATATEQQHVTVVPDNILGVEGAPRPATFVAFAYVPVLRHLGLGSHRVQITADLFDLGPQTQTYVVNVVKHLDEDDD